MRTISKDLGRPDDVGFIAEQNGNAVGIAFSRILADAELKGYGNIDDKTPELLVSVMPEHRGQGVGKRLLDALHTELAMLGYKQISLSVQKTNQAAKLYQRLGYTVLKEQQTDYVMVKQLI